METLKGSSSFRMHLARISVDGEDEPIGREATLCLRLQQDQTALSPPKRQLMDIYIDGRLMACWDFGLLKQHPSYQSIHTFSTYTISKYISLKLPLPLDSLAAPRKNAGCLKTIRIFFRKSQDFHTAINWLSKHAGLIRLDGRPATSNGFHTPASTVPEQPQRPGGDCQPQMAPPARPSSIQPHGQPGARPESRSGRPAAPQYSEQPQSHLQNFDGQPPASRYLQQPRGRRQSRRPTQSVAHGVPVQRRQSDLVRNPFRIPQVDRPASALPSMTGYATGMQMPRAGRMPSRTLSAASMGNRLEPWYGRPIEEALHASSPPGLEAPSRQHSSYNFRNYPCPPSSHERSKQVHVPDRQYLPTNNSELVRMSSSCTLNNEALEAIPIQSTIAADSMGVGITDPYATAIDGEARRRRIISMAPPGSRISDTSPDQLKSGWRSTTSSQIGHLPTIRLPLLRSFLDEPDLPPASLFATTATASQDLPDQGLSLEDAIPVREPDKPQEPQMGVKRALSAQDTPPSTVKKRRANQPIKRAGWPTGQNNDVADHASTVKNVLQMKAAASATLVPSLDYQPSTVAVRASKDVPMVDSGAQTDPPKRLQADVLQLSAALDLDLFLLQETHQWVNADNFEMRLLNLGAQFVRAIYEISGST